MTNFFDIMKSYISIINGILIMLLILAKPFSKWLYRNILSKRNKLILYIQDQKRIFKCIEKKLISEKLFDCPPKEMDSGKINTYSRGYRFKINALIYGDKIVKYLSEGLNEIIITYDNKNIQMLLFLIEKKGKDTQIQLVSRETHSKSLKDTILEVKQMNI